MVLNICNFIQRTEQVPVELDISAIEEYILLYIISGLQNSSPVYDDIHPSILKVIADSYVPLLTYLINKSLLLTVSFQIHPNICRRLS